MPHIILKLGAGRTAQQKSDLAKALANAVVAQLSVEPGSISVAIQDVELKDWVDDVYKPDILAKPDQIYLKPTYNPLSD